MGRRILNEGFTYKLVEDGGGFDNKYFLIEGNKLIIGKQLNWEKPKYSIEVETADAGGLSFKK